MKNRKMLLILFICLVALQLCVPAYMIISREMTLQSGKQFKFKAAPVDPSDPFRGRYVSINIPDSEIDIPEDEEYYGGQTVYVLLENDAQGFAAMKGVSRTKPASGDYFKTRVIYVNPKDMGGTRKLHVAIPFNRYYMEEKAAPQAEEEYNRRAGEINDDVYVTIRVYKGSVVLEKLYVEGVPIEDYLKSKK